MNRRIYKKSFIKSIISVSAALILIIGGITGISAGLTGCDSINNITALENSKYSGTEDSSQENSQVTDSESALTDTQEDGTNSQTTDTVNENVLIVGSDTAYPPFVFNEKGTITGFDIDLIKEIAARMEKEIEIKSIMWDPDYKELIDGTLDIVISAAPVEVSKTTIVDYSEPYYTLEYLLISLNGSQIKSKEDLIGKKIGVLSVGKSNISEYLTKYEISEYEDIKDMLDALKNKKIEGILLSLPLGVNLLKGNVDMYLVLDKIKSNKQFAIVFKKGSSLVPEVNQILDGIIDDGKYQSIYDKWFNYKF